MMSAAYNFGSSLSQAHVFLGRLITSVAPILAQFSWPLTQDKGLCYVSGYAQLTFSSDSGAPAATTVTDGGFSGASLGVADVSLSSSDAGSFLFQYTESNGAITSGCPLETSLSIVIPNQSLNLNVNLNGVMLQVCGSVNVSPIIQGNSIDRYLS